MLVESWSWIASVFTRPWNKAFLSVFLVFGIWDFGMGVIFFVIVFTSSASSSGTFLVSTYPPYSSSFRPAAFSNNSKTTTKKRKSPPLRFLFLSLPPFLCHILKLAFCNFWFMRSDTLLCRRFRLVVKESLVCFSSEGNRRGAVRTSPVIDKKVPRCLLPICLDR